MLLCCERHTAIRVIAGPIMKGALYSAIFVRHFAVKFLRQSGDNIGQVITIPVLYHTRAEVYCECMNACHVPATTVFLEVVCRVCTFRSVCTSTIVSLVPVLRNMVLSVWKGAVKPAGSATSRYVTLARTLATCFWTSRSRNTNEQSAEKMSLYCITGNSSD